MYGVGYFGSNQLHRELRPVPPHIRAPYAASTSQCRPLRGRLSTCRYRSSPSRSCWPDSQLDTSWRQRPYSRHRTHSPQRRRPAGAVGCIATCANGTLACGPRATTAVAHHISAVAAAPHLCEGTPAVRASPSPLYPQPVRRHRRQPTHGASTAISEDDCWRTAARASLGFAEIATRTPAARTGTRSAADARQRPR